MKPDLTTTTVAAAAIVSAAAPAAQAHAVEELISKIKSQDDKVRGPAWQKAGPAGAAAVKPLAEVMTSADFEVARAAKRALWQIVRYAGRHGADDERRAVSRELIGLLEGQPAAVRREALWMLSEIGSRRAVKPIATLLSDREVREDARAALERIPGTESVEALQAALNSVADEFKPAVAQSLRVRGVEVSGYPSQKLTPTRPAPGSTPKTL